jgi:microsomal dipeptidase-like Zn-dependent dipeptidase
MEAVDRQLAAAKEMETYIDNKWGGPGNGWYRIVTSPQEARAVIEAGKLAVVLGIEVDYLFNCHTESNLTEEGLYAELDKYYSLGVRHLFPIHFGDNGFGGAAFQNGLEWAYAADNPGSTWNHTTLNPLNPGGTLGVYEMYTDDAAAFGYKYRTGRRNIKGLTNLGKALIRGMIDRGMIIDVDHMSARSKADALDLCDGVDYPVVASHAGFVEISKGDKTHEGQLLPEEVERIRKLGGMLAVIVHQGTLDEINTWIGPGQTIVPHTCGNTSNTVVQAYLYAASKMQGGPVGFGTDFNGFAGLPGPRFGKDAHNGGGVAGNPSTKVNYPFVAAVTGQQMPCSLVGHKSFDINVDGLAHMGMLPDFIADFQAMGLSAADLEPLLNSAEGYVALWEKAWHHTVVPTQDGTLLGAKSAGIFVIYGGAKFHVPNMDVFNALFSGAPVRELWEGALDGIPTVPRDGTLLGAKSAGIFVIYGGAKFHVPTMDVFNALFPNGQVRELWEGALDGVSTVPRDGTLLREQSSAQVYIIAEGRKYLAPVGVIGIVHVLWDGGLVQIPEIVTRLGK